MARLESFSWAHHKLTVGKPIKHNTTDTTTTPYKSYAVRLPCQAALVLQGLPPAPVLAWVLSTCQVDYATGRKEWVHAVQQEVGRKAGAALG